MKNKINKKALNLIIDQALKEDLANGDITTSCIVGKNRRRINGHLVARQDGVLAGIGVFKAVVKALDKSVKFLNEMKDGQAFRNGGILIDFRGDAGLLLSAERTALNFLQHLSGIATYTNRFVKEIEGTKARITDTRKTLPGLRMIEKYAVTCGGGKNHRFSLSDLILIKDNHIAFAGGIPQALEAVRRNAPKSLKIEVETENPDQVKEALRGGADIIMLDNFDIDEMRRAVQLIAGKATVEASGNVNLENIRQIAETGVDLISIGRITHSAPGVDISMEFEKL